MAAGSPKPMVPMLPEVSHSRGSRKSRYLRGPHLVLAHAGGDDGFAAGDAIDFLEHVVRLDQRAVAVVVHRVVALQLGQFRVPLREVGLAARCARSR